VFFITEFLLLFLLKSVNQSLCPGRQQLDQDSNIDQQRTNGEASRPGDDGNDRLRQLS
jgi:hypothetical protein